MRPLVSIVTINYNQLEVTSALLVSLRQITYPNFEVVVVDNGSSGDDAERLKARFPEFKIIANGENSGFTGGNNLGLRYTNADYVLLLNNDTEVAPNFLEPLIEVMESDTRIGVASPKIRYYSNPERIQYAGCEAINTFTGRGTTRGYRERDHGQYDIPIRTELAHGAAMMIRREVLETVGVLGTQFFIYYEEFDFCERVKKAGYQIYYVPGSLVLHKESMTVGKDSAFKMHYMTRNRLLFLRRNVEGAALLASILFVLLVSVPVQTIRLVRRGRFDLLAALYRGLLWHLGARNIHANTFLQGS